jgi:hypothetical protein
MALFARETARRYRNLKRKYPEPKHADFLEREARASYRRAIFWVDRARLARGGHSWVSRPDDDDQALNVTTLSLLAA